LFKGENRQLDGQESQAATITKVEKQKRSKHRYNIFIQDEYAFSVHEDLLIKHRLFKGELLDPAQMATILQDEERHGAYLKALGMIGRRLHSTKEVKQKLKRQGYEDAVIQWAVEMLLEQNYMNDEEFAKLWTENRIISQRKGRNVVKQELQQKGISREHIQEAISNINPEDEYQSAYLLGKKKWLQSTGTGIDRKRKTGSFLLRRGFTNAVVSNVLKQIINEAGEKVELIEEDGFFEE
jgi:regulatory protein